MSPCTAILTSLVLAAEHAAHQGALPDINWWAWDPHRPPMGWFIIDFALFVLGFWRLGRRPMRRLLRQRRRSIAGAIAAARSAHAEAVAAAATAQARLQGAPEAMERLLAEAEAEGRAEHDRIVAQAAAYAASLLRDSATQVHQEEQRTRRQLQQLLRRTVLARAQALLEADMTDADRDALFAHGLADLGQAPEMAADARSL